MSPKTLRILLVEEDPLEARRIRESAGEPDGYRLEWTHAGEWTEDRARLEGGGFDAILVDLDAPDARGMNALLATMLAAPGVPVLALAGTWNETVALEAILAGAQDVLLKGEIRRDSFGRTLLAAVERRKLEHAHETNEHLYRRIVESSDQGICLADGDSRIVFANRKLGEMLGHAATEMAGKSLFDFMDEDARAGVKQALEPHRRGFRGNRDVQFLHKNGTRIWTSITMAPLFGAEGQKTGLLATVTDITDRRTLEMHLQQSQRIESIGRLAGTIAHDFNNLLTVILGNTDLLATLLPAGGEELECLESTRKASEQATRLTQQLLAFSRRQLLQPKVLNLNAILLGMKEMLRRMIREDIDLEYRLSPDLGGVKADLSQIEQVVVNLVVNARDAIPGIGRITLATSNAVLDEAVALRYPYVQPGPYTRFEVTDNGIGMDANVLSHIFEPFFSTKTKGAGLGLSTVYGIVKQSGGYIWARSEPGKGASFEIDLPRVGNAPAPEPEAPAAQAVAGNGTETILVAEDEDMIRALAKKVLQANGYTVLEGSNGVEALSAAEPHPGRIHLLLSDIVMPRMGGLELAQRFSSLRPDAKILLMSGYASREALRESWTANLPILQKPFTPGTLLKKVRGILDAPGRSAPAG